MELRHVMLAIRPMEYNGVLVVTWLVVPWHLLTSQHINNHTICFYYIALLVVNRFFFARIL